MVHRDAAKTIRRVFFSKRDKRDRQQIREKRKDAAAKLDIAWNVIIIYD